MVKHREVAENESLERFEIKIEQETLKHYSKRNKCLTVTITSISITVYLLYIIARYANHDAVMQFWSATYGVAAEMAIGAFLLYHNNRLKKVSRKQFGRLIPQKVR